MCALVTGVEMCAHPISAPWVEGCRSRGEGHLGIGDLPHATGILCEGLTQADPGQQAAIGPVDSLLNRGDEGTKRSEEHTSELQSLMRISYAVFCLKKKKK